MSLGNWYHLPIRTAQAKVTFFLTLNVFHLLIIHQESIWPQNQTPKKISALFSEELFHLCLKGMPRTANRSVRAEMLVEVAQS